MALLALAVLVPVLAATALAAVSPLVALPNGRVSAVVAVAVTVLCALVLARSGQRMILWFGGWQPRGGAAIGVAFAADRLGAGMATFVAALAVVAFVQAAVVISGEALLLDAIALVFLAATVGFSLTGDLFDLFVFFELMSVAAYVLVAHDVRRRAPLEGALAFAVTNSIGSILLLFGIALVYGRTGALNLAQIGRALEAGGIDGSVVVAFAFVAAGLLVKAAVVPFHLWTADAYAVAPTPVCILLGGAFSELGLYGLARVYWTAFHAVLAPHQAELRAVLVGAGVLTALLGAVMCAAQHHLKRLLAFATISQVGLFLAGVGLLDPDALAGAAVWVVADGLVKAGLFACVGVVQHRCDDLEEPRLHGRARSLRAVGALVVLGALLIASLPPSGSFLGRALVEDRALRLPGYGWLPLVMTAVGAVVGGTLLRFAARVFLGWGEPGEPDPRGLEAEPAEDEREDDGVRSPRAVLPVLAGSAGVLLLAAFAWGLVPGLRDAAGAAAHLFADTRGYAAATLDGRSAPAHAPPTPAPSTAAFLYALATVLGALGWAAAALAGWGGRLPRALDRALTGLRLLHSGRPGDYVAWTAAGAALLGTLLALVTA